MATIITPGRTPAPPEPPWYLGQPLTCPRCGCVFRLDEGDLLPAGGSPAFVPHKWHVVTTVRTPGGGERVAGDCPGCGEFIRIEGKNGAPL